MSHFLQGNHCLCLVSLISPSFLGVLAIVLNKNYSLHILAHHIPDKCFEIKKCSGPSPLHVSEIGVIKNLTGLIKPLFI